MITNRNNSLANKLEQYCTVNRLCSSNALRFAFEQIDASRKRAHLYKKQWVIFKIKSKCCRFFASFNKGLRCLISSSTRRKFPRLNQLYRGKSLHACAVLANNCRENNCSPSESSGVLNPQICQQ